MGEVIKDQHDAYGHGMRDHLQGKAAFEIVERDDGYISIAGGPNAYFREYPDWPLPEKKAMKYVRGRVLDIGCGAGRHCLYLQEKGSDATGIDNSPLAIRVCRKRGVKKAKVMSITQVSPELGTFDTILMMGNNFGLFGGFKRARWLLKRFHKMTSESARIIAWSSDPHGTTEPFHLQYHQLNQKKGRMAGQVRIRVRYKKFSTPWFDYLLVSKEEMRQILEGTGWRVERFIESGGPAYVAIIQKEAC